MSLRMALLALLALVASQSAGRARAQSREERTVRAATDALDEIMAVPLKGIPQSLLEDAEAIAIVPNVIKGSFVVGARHGKGVLLVRDEAGAWTAPLFVSLTGGNIGWQIGLQATDVVLVFKTRKSVDGILQGKFTLGVDAAAAAGPVGRQASAATDEKLKAEIYSYSRSRGLFAGVSIDGSALSIDHAAGAAYYPRATPDGSPLVPESAARLVGAVLAYSGAETQDVHEIPVEPSFPAPALAPFPESVPPVSRAEELRGQLVQAAPRLYGLLDGRWQSYLALPAVVYEGGEPSAEALADCLARFDAVAGDSRYRTLAARPEFQSTHDLLKRYVAANAPRQSSLHLPPPPGAIQRR